MANKAVPNDNLNIKEENSFGNMIIESEGYSINAPNNKENNKNVNLQITKNNSINSNTFPSSIRTKNKHKKSCRIKGDTSNNIKCKIKTSMSLKGNLKVSKNKNKSDDIGSKKLSINQKISQSNQSFNDNIKEKIKLIKTETNLSEIKEIYNQNDKNEMNIETNDDNNNISTENLLNNNSINNNQIINDNLIINNQIINNNSIINNEINFEYITAKNNIKEIKNPPLTSITYKEFNSTLIPFEYLNDIWESFIEKEKFNNYSYKDIISIQTDIKEPMRCILIDWIISLQNKFFRKKDTLFLTINLIDRYLSKKSILRTEFQLLGVTSLFIAFKYDEIYMKNINDFVELTARAFDKYQILKMEKTIIDLVEFNLDLPLSNDFFDLLSTVYKFDKKEYIFGCFLLEAFFLDLTCCEYKQSQIALATCFIILGMRQTKIINPIEGNNFIRYFCKEYKVNFDIWQDYDIIVECAKKIYYFFEQSEKINYKEVYKVFNYLFI